MNLTFVSGWAGYSDLYPTLAARAEFIVPFVDMDERALVQHLRQGEGTLLAWSTGAHLTLKHWRAIEPCYERIILAAPFLDFTMFTPERVLRLMLRQFARQPEAVMETFLKKCGGPRTAAFIPTHVSALADGLRFLLESKAHPAHAGGHKTILVQGEQDRIVAPEAAEDILHHLHGATYHALPCGHWIPEQELAALLG